MIVSYDTIIRMKPPYDITAEIVRYISSISEKIGEIKATYQDRQNPLLRKQNKIKTIHSSLKIEGNTLTEGQITAILENKHVIGPPKDILEVVNAIDVYDRLSQFKAKSEKDFLAAHALLMKGLIPDAGKYRRQGVGIMKGAQVAHVAPSYENVPYLMKDLFAYLDDKTELALIKSWVDSSNKCNTLVIQGSVLKNFLGRSVPKSLSGSLV